MAQTFEPGDASLRLEDLVAQWLRVSDEEDTKEQVVVNLDFLGDGVLFGAVNVASFANPQYGEIYDLAVHVVGDHFEASAQLQVQFDELFRRKPNPSQQTKLAAEATLSADGKTLTIAVPDASPPRKWRLTKQELDEGPPSVSHGMSWGQFCDWAHKLNAPKRTFLYRGHKRSTFRLRRSFHRTSRTDLFRYLNEIPELGNRITAHTGTRFNLGNMEELVELLGIGQHHG